MVLQGRDLSMVIFYHREAHHSKYFAFSEKDIHGFSRYLSQIDQP